MVLFLFIPNVPIKLFFRIQSVNESHHSYTHREGDQQHIYYTLEHYLQKSSFIAKWSMVEENAWTFHVYNILYVCIYYDNYVCRRWKSNRLKSSPYHDYSLFIPTNIYYLYVPFQLVISLCMHTYFHVNIRTKRKYMSPIRHQCTHLSSPNTISGVFRCIPQSECKKKRRSKI